jgi:lipid II:glycine glycyltransferase (peptidoglycan interpeptide bridge formation enzyme)
LGGISNGGDGDPYAGITTFKRQFSKEILEVAEEWIFEPRPFRAAITRIVGDWRFKFRGITA